MVSSEQILGSNDSGSLFFFLKRPLHSVSRPNVIFTPFVLVYSNSLFFWFLYSRSRIIYKSSLLALFLFVTLAMCVTDDRHPNRHVPRSRLRARPPSTASRDKVVSTRQGMRGRICCVCLLLSFPLFIHKFAPSCSSVQMGQYGFYFLSPFFFPFAEETSKCRRETE